MATRSIIAYFDNQAENFKAVYCHYDGYLENNGLILSKLYQDENDVKKLIAGGDMSSLLSSKTGLPEYYNEQDVKIGEYNSLIELIEYKEKIGAILYIYLDGKWMLWCDAYQDLDVIINKRLQTSERYQESYKHIKEILQTHSTGLFDE